MQAWVFRPMREDGSGVYLFLEEVPIPSAGPEDLLLKLRKVSVCGTDEALFRAKIQRVKNGMIPGHEFCGEVVERGSQARDFAPGEIVVGESHYRVSGSSEEGIIGLWAPNSDDGRKFEPIAGAYAEYVRIPKLCARRIPRRLVTGPFWPSLLEAAGNDFCLAQYVLEKLNPQQLGIFGCGPHGLYAQIFLRFLGARRFFAFETDPFRLEFARTLGVAEEVYDPSSVDWMEKLQQKSGAGTLDVTVDMVGRSGKAFEQCCRLTRPGGAVILFGIFNRGFSINGISPNDLIFGRRELDYEYQGKKLKLIGITGREGVWDELIAAVAGDRELRRLLMKPVTVVGPLDLLGESIRQPSPHILKRAFSSFQGRFTREKTDVGTEELVS